MGSSVKPYARKDAVKEGILTEVRTLSCQVINTISREYTGGATLANLPRKERDEFAKDMTNILQYTIDYINEKFDIKSQQ